MQDLPTTNKRLGQHWLSDPASLAAMCAAAELQPTDTILEIGPGAGTLTQYLTQQAARVIAVEVDTELATALPSRVPAPNLQVVQQDILRFDLTALPAGYKIVANIPYYLTSQLVRVISETTHQPSRAVLLVQKEVAERLAAQPGALSILGVTAQFFWEVTLDRVVPAQLFTPPPKVDSQIVCLTRRAQPLFPDVQPDDFFRLVKAGFSAKRKTLLNALSGGLRLPKATVQDFLQKAGLEPSRRAQSLSLQDWHQLYVVINT